MIVENQPTIVMGLSILFYLASAIYFLFKGWFLRAGIAMLFAAFLPLIWQVIFTDSDAVGFAFYVMLMAPFPIAMIAAGLLAAFYRAGMWAFHRLGKRRLPRLQ